MNKRLLIACARIAWFAPIGFTAVVLAQELLQPDYDRVAMPISALAAWPLGWLQNLNFYFFGTCMIAFALAVHYSVRPTRYGVAGIAALLISGLGIVLSGVFPWIRVEEAPTETPGHIVGAVMTFVGAGVGLILVSRRLAADSRWSGLARYVLGSGIGVLVMFIVMGPFAMNEGSVLHPWAGFLQRIVLAIWLPCIIVVARRALRIARAEPGTR